MQLAEFEMGMSIDQSWHEHCLTQVDIRLVRSPLDDLDDTAMADYQLSWVEQSFGRDDAELGLNAEIVHGSVTVGVVTIK